MPKVSQEHAEQRRQEIQEAALAVFVRKGYEPTTMKDIVAASGKSFGGVYMYYASKEEIFSDLVIRRYQAMGGAIPAGETSAWEALSAFLADQEQRITAGTTGLPVVIYEFLLAARRDEGRRPFVQQRYSAVYGAVESLLRRGAESGEFRPRLPLQHIAHTVISLLDGMFLESCTSGSERVNVGAQFQVLRSTLYFLLEVNP